MSYIDDMVIQANTAKEFEVQLELPETFAFYGEVPYDMHVYGRTAFITVPADSIEQAMQLAQDYVNGGTHDDE